MAAGPMAEESVQAREWFLGLERRILGLARYPARAPTIPEDDALRHLLYGRKRNVYRIIYAVDESRRIVTVLHIRHGAQGAFNPDEEDG